MSIDGEVKRVKVDVEALLRPYKDIIPDTLEKEMKQSIKDGDNEKVNKILMDKIMPIINAYTAKTNNENLNEGEQIIWIHDVTKGVFKKEVAQKWMITNQRVFIQILPTKENPKTVTGGLGLAVSDCVVMNQKRSSKGNRVGTFTGVGSGGIGVGTAVGSSSSTSETIGDLVFLCDGKEAIRFLGVSDPHGVKRIIDTLKKQTKI